MSVSDESETLHQEPEAEAQTQEFLMLLAGVPWLLKQYFADSINLLETEGRLALRSVLMLAALTLFLAGLIAGIWLVLVGYLGYVAFENGMPAWGIALSLLGLHLLALVAVAAQVKALARYLFFPNSRRAFAALVSRERPPINP